MGQQKRGEKGVVQREGGKPSVILARKDTDLGMTVSQRNLELLLEEFQGFILRVLLVGAAVGAEKETDTFEHRCNT